jgi:hypothetical protein
VDDKAQYCCHRDDEYSDENIEKHGFQTFLDMSSGTY